MDIQPASIALAYQQQPLQPTATSPAGPQGAPAAAQVPTNADAGSHSHGLLSSPCPVCGQALNLIA